MADTSGPIFHADAEVEGMLHEIEAAIARRGYELVQANLSSSIRHPTGYYQSTIHVARDGSGAQVTDSGTAVYNTWLEGTSSRNSPRTRFPGYWSFRRATEELDTQTTEIAEPIVREFIAAVS